MAMIPPPGMPMLPLSSCMIVKQRMFWTPIVCCVMPSAYMMMAGPSWLTQMSAARWMSSAGMPVTFETISTV